MLTVCRKRLRRTRGRARNSSGPQLHHSGKGGASQPQERYSLGGILPDRREGFRERSSEKGLSIRLVEPGGKGFRYRGGHHQSKTGGRLGGGTKRSGGGGGIKASSGRKAPLMRGRDRRIDPGAMGNTSGEQGVGPIKTKGIA